jgi:hypothetical protein
MPQRGNLKRRAYRALDAANFTLADVRDGLGPYLAIDLLTGQHWDEARIGAVMAGFVVFGLASPAPAGEARRSQQLPRQPVAAE